MSVSDVKLAAPASSSSRSVWKFSMIPLWTTTNSPRRIGVGMGVEIARLTVRRPPGVADADRPGQRLDLEQRVEVADLAFRLPDVDRAVGDGDPGRVVAPVLESSQPLERIGAASRGPT